jgi:UPF0755 protein
VSDLGLKLETPKRRHRAKSPGHGRGCLAVSVAVVILLAVSGFAVLKGRAYISELLSPPADYTGPGHGTVVVIVHSGDTATDIGATLQHRGVVKSVEAFTDAARENVESRSIQVGSYRLKLELPAKTALAMLLSSDNRLANSVTIPEGYTTDQTVKTLGSEPKFTGHQVAGALKRLRLPRYAHGNPEGFLFPASYEIGPDTTAGNLLQSMVTKFDQVSDRLRLTHRANALGKTPRQIVTIASLIQGEAQRLQDFGKVARVVYNRLHIHMKLQFDSTIHYVVGKDGNVATTPHDRNVKSPYNTYKHAGLPPGPINSPGAAALRAALHPTPGHWLYFVTVNAKTGKTLFANTYAQHLRHVQEWCSNSDEC